MLYLKYSVVWDDLYWPRWGAEVMKTESSRVRNISLLIRSRHGWQKFITPTSRWTHVGASYGSDYPLHNKLLLKLRSSLLHFKDGVFLKSQKKNLNILLPVYLPYQQLSLLSKRAIISCSQWSRQWWQRVCLPTSAGRDLSLKQRQDLHSDGSQRSEKATLYRRN